MNTPPLSPHQSSTESTSSSSANVGQWRQEGESSTSRQPAGFHSYTTNDFYRRIQPLLTTYQASAHIPTGQPDWMAPEIPMPTAPEGSSSPALLQLELHLGQWINESSDDDMKTDRAIVADEISKVIRGHQDYLAHDNLKLGNLPEIFDHPLIIANLKVVALSDCELDRVPMTLLHHQTLELLNITSCALSQIPEFGNMPKLKDLVLSDNKLPRLPESIGRLTSLIELKVDENELDSLPASISNLQRLDKLDATGNAIENLPDDLTGLRSLRSLNVSNNPLRGLPESLRHLPLTKLKAWGAEWLTLPEVITSLRSLTHLDLSASPLTTLPPRISQLAALTKLELAHSQLTSLPEEIVQLPQQCVINLTGNPLSQAIINNLMNMQGGPQIHFSVNDDEEPENQATLPLEENAGKWITLTPEQSERWKKLGGNEEARHFNTWLELMGKTADFENQQTRPGLLERVNKLLSHITKALMASRQDQVEPFLGAAHEATSTCRDRIAMGMNSMEMILVNQLAERGEMSLSQLMTLGRELFILDQIGEVASAKVANLRLVDEVEVYLAYQVGLKRTMGLTLGNEDMLYHGCSQVSDEDIAAATESTQMMLALPTPLRDFLAQWQPIRTYIQREFVPEWQAIEEKYNSLLEQADDSGDWTTLRELGKQRSEAFDRFCESKVQVMLRTDLPSSSRQSEEQPNKRPRLD